MLLENYIRLLLESPQVKLGDLMKYPGKLLVGKKLSVILGICKC
jgi:hypothetical protein